MSIYIEGENLPSKYPVCLVIWPDGRTEKYAVANVDSEKTGECKAEQVPSHGNLIDADKFLEWVREFHQESACWLAPGVLNAPVIIPADCPVESASVRSISMSKESTEINTASKKDDPVDTIQNDAYLLSCQCPVCMHSITRGYNEGVAYCEKCGQKLRFPPFAKDEIDNALFEHEMDSYED